MLKPEIHDPQGEAVLSAAHRLGFGQVTGVRQGKRFEIELDGPADEMALQRVRELADELLANSVIEEFSLRVASAMRVGRVADVRIGVVIFPGSLDGSDALRAVAAAGAEPVSLWHNEQDLSGADAVILPGGFSYGDYLRCGAIARFSPVMASVTDAARAGMPVLGICNGFQILCEARLLPGALARNKALRFICRDVRLRLEDAGTPWTGGYSEGAELVIPLKSGEGAYVADEATLASLEANGQVVARYADGAPNGAIHDIAAVRNEAGNVVGLMPHPEHAISPLTGPSSDGLGFFTSVVAALPATSGAGAAR
jgi:phosphoribosylformylglycinamidine synthase